MSLRSAPVKVLRIGLIQNGSLVSERVLSPGEAYATPQIFSPTSAQPLFQPDAAGRLTLTLPPGATARVMRGAEVLTLRAGDRLLLDDQDRGKLSFEQGTLLFQLVLPTLVAVDAKEFRPRLFELDDPSYYGFLSVFSAAALAFSVLVNVTPPRTSVVTIDDLPRAVTEVMLAVTPPPDPVELERVAADAGKRVKPRVVSPRPAESAPSDSGVRAARDAAPTSNLAEDMKLVIAAMGSRGVSSQSWTVADLIDQVSGDGRDLDAALKGVNGVETASTDGFTARDAKDGGRRDADIGALSGGRVGASTVNEGPEVAVHGAVKFEADAGSTTPAALEKGQADALRQQVKRQIGQVRTCYESQLKEDPTLSGRLVLSWMVSGGRALDVRVEESSIRSEALSACVVGRVKGWTFDRDIDTEVRYPFVFEPAS